MTVDPAAGKPWTEHGGRTFHFCSQSCKIKFETAPQDYLDAKPVLETGTADAQCVDGMLLVQEIRSPNYSARPMGRDNYHIYDYSLFHMNVRKNAETRVAQYLAGSQSATQSEGQ